MICSCTRMYQVPHKVPYANLDKFKDKLDNTQVSGTVAEDKRYIILADNPMV